MMRVILDSNVILSGLMSPKGTTGQIIQAWKDNCLTLLIRDATITPAQFLAVWDEMNKEIKNG